MLMENHQIIHNNVPLEFRLVRSKKRKRTISIHVNATKGVEIKVPHATSIERVNTLIKTRFNWIKERLNVIPITLTPWYEQNTLFYLGQRYPVQIETFPFAKIRGECVLENTHFQVTLAQGLTASAQQNLYKRTLENWYRERAREVLSERTDYFVTLMQVKPNTIIIKTQKRRWGSCDAKNNIRYNWKIIMAEPALIDYLIVHELAHIKHKNHSKKFWNFVASRVPDHQQRRKKLHQFGQSISEG